MNLTFSLFRLQSCDTQLQKISNRLKQIETILLADEETRVATLTRDEAKKVVESLQSDIKALAEECAARKLKADLAHAQLYGGAVRSPKELQELQAEEASHLKAVSMLEDEQLAAMSKLDVAQSKLEEAEKALKGCIDKKAADNSLLLGEKSNLENQIPSIEAQKNALVALLPADILTQYQQLLRSKGGKAVAQVIDDGCDICGVELNPADMQQVKSPQKIFRCKSCGRILYMA